MVPSLLLSIPIGGVILAVAFGIAEAWTERLVGPTGPKTKIETGQATAADRSAPSNPYLPPESDLATEVNINRMLTFENAFGMSFLQFVVAAAIRLTSGPNRAGTVVVVLGSFVTVVVGMA